MKEFFKLIVIIIILFILSIAAIKLFDKKDESEDNELEKINAITKYYTYEGKGKFTMSSISNKVDNYKELNNNYYIKERITKEKSKGRIIEVLYNDFEREPYLYGYYNETDFNKYFQEQIKNGLVCDNKTLIGLGEGVNIKCISHEAGFEYDKIDSELCAYINDKEICIKPNDWYNIESYKEKFESVGWICEYQDSGEWSNDKKPTNGNLECSKERPSTRNYKEGELFCFIGTDGGAVCNNNIGWCSINDDLNTFCFGVK